ANLCSQNNAPRATIIAEPPIPPGSRWAHCWLRAVAGRRATATMDGPARVRSGNRMSQVDNDELHRMLRQAFDAASAIYKERGFQRRVGFGRRPALVSVDLANAWTRPGNPFTCDQEKMNNEIIPGMQRLLEACRANGHPVIHV